MLDGFIVTSSPPAILRLRMSIARRPPNPHAMNVTKRARNVTRKPKSREDDFDMPGGPCTSLAVCAGSEAVEASVDENARPRLCDSLASVAVEVGKEATCEELAVDKDIRRCRFLPLSREPAIRIPSAWASRGGSWKGKDVGNAFTRTAVSITLLCLPRTFYMLLTGENQPESYQIRQPYQLATTASGSGGTV